MLVIHGINVVIVVVIIEIGKLDVKATVFKMINVPAVHQTQLQVVMAHLTNMVMNGIMVVKCVVIQAVIVTGFVNYLRK